MDDDFDHGDGASPAFTKLVNDVSKELEKSGFFLMTANAMPTNFHAFAELMEQDGKMPDPYDLLMSGDSGILLNVELMVNKVAFSDRVLNPDKYDTDAQFKAMMPTETELEINRIREAAKKGGLDAILNDEDDLDLDD